ncbi:glycosyltransferase family 39 protein [Litorilinea aerophila]|uniref:Phospholipid carrier-dependent glycosyltransferase n=1 Tax=Litorilinea aerophila TaxID=1204385 RepID=A0A540VGD5_9CHLR|nr:phospholipid carrier-dependent glycosyltransferase [Litorilinea aerophila]MCC9076494.1 glycosyltransferase family 39 protein [Litorilinea aerophila]
MKWSRLDWILLLAVTLLAAGLRFYRLGEVPPGFQFDEAFNAIDARLVLQGHRPLFLPANAGREVLYTYWQALLASLFGLNVYTLRLASALAGIVAVPATYLLLRTLLRQGSRAIALFTSLALCLSLWHIHFSHYGIRVITMPVIFSGLFGLYWLGHHGSSRRVRLAAYGLAGVLAGLSVWTHPTGRFVPFVLILYTAWLWWRSPAHRRLHLDSPVGGLLLTGAVAFLVFLPLGLEFYRHPEFFFGHASEVSVFAPRVGGDAPWRVLMGNFFRVLGMFSVAGDREWTHNLAGRPVFDPLMAIPFYIGLILWAERLWRRRGEAGDVDALALLALWAGIMLFPSILSEAAPNYSRTLPALPALFVPVGLGLHWLWERRHPVPWLGPALVAVIVPVSGGLAAYDYFGRFANSPEVYYMYDAEKLDALAYLAELTGDNQVYLSQLWGDMHATVFYLRGNLGIKSLDTTDTLVLPPPGQGAVYAFPPEQKRRAERLAESWPALRLDVVPDRYGEPLLYTLALRPEDAQEWPAPYEPTQTHTAAFQGAPTLLGMRPESDAPALRLYWRADEPMGQSLTSFVHLLDQDGHRVAQMDKLPGNGSYATIHWTPGERVIDRYPLNVLDLCAGGETLRVQVGWYQAGVEGALDAQPLRRADAPGHTALAGQMTLPFIGQPPAQMEPPVRLDLPLREDLALVGYGLTGEDLQAGAPVTLDLYWHSTRPADAPPPTEEPVTLYLARTGQREVLWEGQLAPEGYWAAGEVLCRRLRLRLPAEAAPGTYRLEVDLNEARSPDPTPLADLTLGPSTRLFQPPALTLSTEAILGEPDGSHGQARLLGLATLDWQSPQENPAGAPSLAVDLVWEARSPFPSSYKVFVHLVDQHGQIVAQSDAVPGPDYPVTRWLPGEVVVDRHILAVSGELPPGRYQLFAGLYDPVSAQRLPAYDGTAQRLPDDRVSLGEVTWPPAAP